MLCSPSTKLPLDFNLTLAMTWSKPSISLYSMWATWIAHDSNLTIIKWSWSKLLLTFHHTLISPSVSSLWSSFSTSPLSTTSIHAYTSPINHEGKKCRFASSSQVHHYLWLAISNHANSIKTFLIINIKIFKPSRQTINHSSYRARPCKSHGNFIY